MQPEKPISSGRAAWAAPLAIFCLLGVLLLIAASIVLALIPVYLTAKNAKAATKSTRTINANFATDVTNGRFLTVTNTASVLSQISTAAGLSSSLVSSQSANFVPASAANGKKRQAVSTNTTCERATTLTGDIFVTNYQLNFPSLCVSDSCQERYTNLVLNALRTSYQTFSVNITLSNGTTIVARLVFCSTTSSTSSSACTTTATKNNVYLTNGTALFQFTPATLNLTKVATINCTANNETLNVYSIALQRSGLLWVQMYNSKSNGLKLYTYNISTGICSAVAVAVNQSTLINSQIAFAKNTTDNSESLYASDGYTLRKLNTNSLTVSVVGNFTNGSYPADMTATNDGKLYGVTYGDNGTILSQIDLTTAQSLSQYGLPVSFNSDFYYFTYFPYQSNFIFLHGSQNSTRVMLYNAATNTTTNQTVLSTGGLYLLAVSTCLGA